MIDSLRAMIRILDKIGGYMTHEDQMELRVARELAKRADAAPVDYDGMQLRGDTDER